MVDPLRRRLLGVGLGGLALRATAVRVRAADAQPAELLNVSYDVSRELYTQINPAFVAQWKALTGRVVSIRQSHGGSSKQARSVADGLQADVVTLNQVTDINFLQQTGLVAPGWRERFPNHAVPAYSLPVMLVRAGNPKAIRDWGDLGRPGSQVLMTNPKTSGNGRYAYLANFAWALEQTSGNEAKAKDLVGRVFANVPLFDTGGRGASASFVEQGLGDALVTFESEVNAIVRQYPQAGLQVVVPPASVRADFPVAVVDRVVDRHGTRALATAYLQFLYGDVGQEILARNFNRVINEAVEKRYAAQFPPVKLVTVEARFGGWDQVAIRHFADGGLLDQALALVSK